MEKLLLAVDGTPGSQKGVEYVARVLRGCPHVMLVLFHVVPSASPNLLAREQVRRVERLQEEHPHLAGVFWDRASEEKMERIFREAREVLVSRGFSEKQIQTRFAVRYGDVADVILQQARECECPSIVIGRRGLSRVKEFIQGSTSSKVTRMARHMTVWVVD
jgi:nucleotide-binding universal stress UspA family protein